MERRDFYHNCRYAGGEPIGAIEDDGDMHCEIEGERYSLSDMDD